jgi:CRISPR/Cas system endoribonuclease Cas6 (RAMP superfamily)
MSIKILKSMPRELLEIICLYCLDEYFLIVSIKSFEFGPSCSYHSTYISKLEDQILCSFRGFFNTTQIIRFIQHNESIINQVYQLTSSSAKQEIIDIFTTLLHHDKRRFQNKNGHHIVDEVNILSYKQCKKQGWENIFPSTSFGSFDTLTYDFL